MKLIIDIPEWEFNKIKENPLDTETMLNISLVVKHGIPLDDVKTEIKTFTITEKSEYDIGFNDAVLKCFNIFDNIGKEANE